MPPALLPLPIDAHLDGIVRALREKPSLVLVADPGAGKTTRVPRALLDAGFANTGEIVVLEPRRLAARLAARRVAEELGERVSERVGYQVRFEDHTSSATRVRFVTEGILTRRLVADPTLAGVSCVILDEFHERHLHGDIALALLARMQCTLRPDLRIVVMSATLDAEPVARFLDCEVVRAPGRRWDVMVEHQDRESDRPLHEQVAAAVRRLVGRGPQRVMGAVSTGGVSGDVLVFLPGAAEIRRAQEACDELCRSAGADVVVLHGDLPAEDQDRAVRPAERRKIILATNVAETSITIPGVAAVVDCGLARQARHSPWSGLPSLETVKVSQASAAQRAGRAGRTGPGVCIRLYTRHDHDTRPQHDPPEVRRADLAEAVLSLRASGADPATFSWFESPPAPSLEAAERLLVRLGAVMEGAKAGGLTATGKRMLPLPLHPRLARLVLEADARGAGDRGCLVAALLGEREIALRQTFSGGSARAEAQVVAGSSDLIARVDAFEAAEDDGLRPDRIRTHGLDPGAVMAVARARDQIARSLGRDMRRAARGDAAKARVVRRHTDEPWEQERTEVVAAARERREEESLLMATLAAFPDRVARRRNPNQPDVVLGGGGSARLAETSVVRDAEWMVAVDADERRGAPGTASRGVVTVRLASAISPDWLLDLFADRIIEVRDVKFDAATERVESTARMTYDGLVLDETRERDPRGPEVERALADAAQAAAPARFADPESLARVAARTAFVAAHHEGFPILDETAARAELTSLCAGKRSFAELRDAGLVDALLNRLKSSERDLLDKFAPERVQLPGSRRVKVEYEIGKPPWIESRLQDFFGMREGPRVGGEKIPLVLHLLAPNQRAVQVTTDLSGFWDRHYPAIRKELMRQYPKHAWPEDPRSASPPQPRQK